MTPATIIKEAMADGVTLTLTPTGTIRAKGEQVAVNRWVPIIREHKPAIVVLLGETRDVEPLPDPATEARRKRVLELLAANPSARYALVTNTEADPVIVALRIRDAMQGNSIMTCALLIPAAKYDGFLLLDLLNRYGATVH